MRNTDAAASPATPGTAAIALVIFLLAIGLRVVALGREPLWADEIYSVSFANLSAVGTVLSVLLLDVHPPFYYLQLHAWELFGRGDFWILLNSVSWSAATLLAVYFGTTRQFGSMAGLFALGFCAVMGSELFFSNELRMYAMLSALSALSWIAADRLHADYRFRSAWTLIVPLALIGASHSAGIIAGSAAILYAFPTGDVQRVKQKLPTWLGISAVVAITYLPWTINAGMHHIGHAPAPSVQAASATVGGWLLGYGDVVFPRWVGAGATIVVASGLVFAATRTHRLARIVLCFVLWPLLFATLLSVLVEPIWLDRTFAFCAPFAAIALGSAIGQLLSSDTATTARMIARARLGLAAAVIAGLGWLGYVQLTTPYKPDHYRDLARYLAEHVKPGEVVYAPEAPAFWGACRYLIGPDWGSILKYQDAADLNRLKRWQRILVFLGPRTLERLGLMPESPRVSGFKIPVLTGSSALSNLQTVKATWFISFQDITALHPPLCADRYPQPTQFGRLLLYRLSCNAAT